MTRFAATLLCLAAMLAVAAASTEFEDSNVMDLKDDFEEKVVLANLPAP